MWWLFWLLYCRAVCCLYSKYGGGRHNSFRRVAAERQNRAGRSGTSAGLKLKREDRGGRDLWRLRRDGRAANPSASSSSRPSSYILSSWIFPINRLDCRSSSAPSYRPGKWKKVRRKPLRRKRGGLCLTSSTREQRGPESAVWQDGHYPAKETWLSRLARRWTRVLEQWSRLAIARGGQQDP